MRPVIDRKKCLLCRYCFSDALNDLHCLFLFEMVMFNKVKPSVNCPIYKDEGS